MNFNVFVGTLKSDTMVAFSHGDENFYLTHLECLGHKLPVVMSMHFHEAFVGQRVACTSFMRTTRIQPGKKRKIFSYLYAVLVKPVGDDVKDDRRAEIEGTITEMSDIELADNNQIKREIKLECPIQFRDECTEVVSCRCFDEIARETLPLKVGDKVRIAGYITGGRRSLRLIVRKISKEEN